METIEEARGGYRTTPEVEITEISILWRNISGLARIFLAETLAIVFGGGIRVGMIRLKLDRAENSS